MTTLGPVQLIWLDVPEPELRQRLAQRDNHYMHAKLLTSQLAAFEAMGTEAEILVVDAAQSPSDVIDQIWRQAIDRYLHLRHPWWQR